MNHGPPDRQQSGRRASSLERRRFDLTGLLTPNLPRITLPGTARRVTMKRTLSKFLGMPPPNPWEIVDQEPHPIYQYIKLAITSVTLFPLRFLTLLLAFAFAGIFAWLGMLGYKEPKNLHDTKPMHPLRKMWRYPIRAAARTGLFCFGVWWVRTKKQPGSNKPARILVANHVTYLDIMYLLSLTDLNAVTKAEVLHWPVVGNMCRLFQAIPLHRTDKDSKGAVRREIERRAQPNSGFPPVCIFPEGTMTNGRVLITFKTGPFSCGQPVRPVGLSYPHRHLDLGNAMAPRLIRAMFEVCNHMKAVLLTVHEPTEEEKANPVAYATAVRDSMSEALTVPVTQHSYEDFFLLSMARSAKISQDFEMAQIQELFKLTLPDVKALILKFKKLDTDGDGMLSLESFQSILGFGKAAPHVQTVFQILDPKGEGKVDFKQFMYGLTVLHKDAKLEDKVSLALQIYDSNNDGHLTRGQISEVLHLAHSSGLLQEKRHRESMTAMSTGKIEKPGKTEKSPSFSRRTSGQSSCSRASASGPATPMVMWANPAHANQTVVLNQLFREHDPDNTGKISTDTLKTALSSGGYGELLDGPLQLVKQMMLPPHTVRQVHA